MSLLWNHLQIFGIYSLGQNFTLHLAVWLAGPNAWSTQVGPSCLGTGFVQLRVRVISPPPQVAVHLLQSDHSVYPPGTVVI